MFYEFYEKGGIVVIPLLICSVLAVAVVAERFWSTRRTEVIPKNLNLQIGKLIAAGKIDEAVAVCLREDSPLSRILLSGLKVLNLTRDEITQAVEITGRRELSRLQRYIGILGTIAAIAPLLGLLGTVVGIIRTFSLIEQHGIGNPQLLAGGISEALIATASGIIIAVPCVIFYRFFLQRTKSLALELEGSAYALLFEIGRSVK